MKMTARFLARLTRHPNTDRTHWLVWALLGLLLAAMPRGAHDAVRRAASMAAVVVDGLDDELSPGSLSVLARLLQIAGGKGARVIITTRHRKRELLDMFTASGGPTPVDDLPDFEQHPQQRGGAADQRSAIEQRLALYAHFAELPPWGGTEERPPQ